MSDFDDIESFINDISEDAIEAEKRHKELVSVLKMVIKAIDSNKVDITFPDISPLVTDNKKILDEFAKKLNDNTSTIELINAVKGMTKYIFEMNNNFGKLADKLDVMNNKLSEKAQWEHHIERNLQTGTIKSITSTKK